MEENLNDLGLSEEKEEEINGEEIISSPNEKVLSLFELSPKDVELKSVKKTANGIGICLIVTFLLASLWVYPVILILRIIGIPLSSFYAFINNPYLFEPIQSAIMILSLILPYIILVKAKKQQIGSVTALQRPKKGTAIPFLLLGIGVCAITNVFTSVSDSFFGSLFGSMGVGYSVDLSDSSGTPLLFIISLLSTAVAPALAEEFAMRGVVFGLLREHGEAFAIFFSGFVFSLMHGNFVQIPFAFLLGLMFALIRIKTGSIWIAVLVHFINNFISVIFEHIFAPLPDMVSNIIYLFYLIIAIALGIAGALLISSRNLLDGAFAENTQGIKTASLIKKAFFTPAIIIFTALLVLLSLSFITF